MAIRTTTVGARANWWKVRRTLLLASPGMAVVVVAVRATVVTVDPADLIEHGRGQFIGYGHWWAVAAQLSRRSGPCRRGRKRVAGRFSPDLCRAQASRHDGRPIAFASYCVITSDGTVFSGMLDADGHVRIEGVGTGVAR